MIGKARIQPHRGCSEDTMDGSYRPGERLRIGIACQHLLVLQVLGHTIRDLFDEPPIFNSQELRQLPTLVASERPHVLLYVVSSSLVDDRRLTRQVADLQQSTRVLVIDLRPQNQNAIELDLLRAGVAGILLDTSNLSELAAAVEKVVVGGRHVPDRLQRVVTKRYLAEQPEAPETALTPREIEVCRALASGKTNREIAEDLYISTKTVDTHRSNLLRKLELRNNSDLTRFALRQRMIHLEP